MRTTIAFGTNTAMTMEEISQSPSAMAQPQSTWRSPLPYLFGGLAATLGLIGFALLILACSYWRLSGRLDNSQGGGDLENGDRSKEVEPEKFCEEKILVIMAGNQKPTFLATPVWSNASSFADKNAKFEDQQRDKSANGETIKENSVNQDLTLTATTTATTVHETE
ncbi:hypothetical protein K2173_003580 [Erythroxylum novogranatense]|uniref:Uncharacterized protein n=1 Tax=Erythroxylum novogranatense TaxID=1862640 RepID=A0AAV8TAQ6_9ROSI|nr:hypothetical protein K2173_003580 [Erythroxylum novogranatense]